MHATSSRIRCRHRPCSPPACAGTKRTTSRKYRNVSATLGPALARVPGMVRRQHFLRTPRAGLPVRRPRKLRRCLVAGNQGNQGNQGGSSNQPPQDSNQGSTSGRERGGQMSAREQDRDSQGQFAGTSGSRTGGGTNPSGSGSTDSSRPSEQRRDAASRGGQVSSQEQGRDSQGQFSGTSRGSSQGSGGNTGNSGNSGNTKR